MGCACSKGIKVDESDSVSFVDCAVGGRGASVAPESKMGRRYYSGELGLGLPGKPVASKVPEASSFFGRAGTYGLDKAVEVLDTLGSSMSNLNPHSGFLAGVASRGNKISILAFEVANTIAKGANLMQSLSEENIHFLKKEILTSEGVRQLVSANTNELLNIAASDKREEFRVFSVEVVRFGNLCKEPELHNLARYFEILDSDTTPKEKLRDEAERSMQQLISLVRHTSELYHEFHALDRLEKDCKRKFQEEQTLHVSQRGETLLILHSELKHQRKLVKSLQKKSLWSKNLEEVVGKLVEVVVFLHKEILAAFDLTGTSFVEGTPVHGLQRLGVSGLALHYANVINQINRIVSRSIAFPPNTRDAIYRGLPVTVKAALRSRLQSFYVKDELTVSLIKSEMKKILHWMSPMAEHTIVAHQGFGWVGEWANMGSDVDNNPSKQNGVFRIQTLYHADKEKTDEHILQLVVWLHHLVDQMKSKGLGVNSRKPIHFPPRKSILSSSSPETSYDPVGTGKVSIFQLSREDRQMMDSVCYQRLVLVRSKSQGLTDTKEKRGKENFGLSSSTGNSPVKQLRTKTFYFRPEKSNFLDIIDGLSTHDRFL